MLKQAHLMRNAIIKDPQSFVVQALVSLKIHTEFPNKKMQVKWKTFTGGRQLLSQWRSKCLHFLFTSHSELPLQVSFELKLLPCRQVQPFMLTS